MSVNGASLTGQVLGQRYLVGELLGQSASEHHYAGQDQQTAMPVHLFRSAQPVDDPHGPYTGRWSVQDRLGSGCPAPMSSGTDERGHLYQVTAPITGLTFDDWRTQAGDLSPDELPVLGSMLLNQLSRAMDAGLFFSGHPGAAIRVNSHAPWSLTLLGLQSPGERFPGYHRPGQEPPLGIPDPLDVAAGILVAALDGQSTPISRGDLDARIQMASRGPHGEHPITRWLVSVKASASTRSNQPSQAADLRVQSAAMADILRGMAEPSTPHVPSLVKPEDNPDADAEDATMTMSAQMRAEALAGLDLDELPSEAEVAPPAPVQSVENWPETVSVNRQSMRQARAEASGAPQQRPHATGLVIKLALTAIALGLGTWLAMSMK